MESHNERNRIAENIRNRPPTPYPFTGNPYPERGDQQRADMWARVHEVARQGDFKRFEANKKLQEQKFLENGAGTTKVSFEK